MRYGFTTPQKKARILCEYVKTSTQTEIVPFLQVQVYIYILKTRTTVVYNVIHASSTVLHVLTAIYKYLYTLHVDCNAPHLIIRQVIFIVDKV